MPSGFFDRPRHVFPVPLYTAPGPDRIFVELKEVLVDTAIDHGAESTIADRQGFHPLAGRLPVPEHEIMFRGSRFALELTCRLFEDTGAWVFSAGGFHIREAYARSGQQKGNDKVGSRC